MAEGQAKKVGLLREKEVTRLQAKFAKDEKIMDFLNCAGATIEKTTIVCYPEGASGFEKPVAEHIQGFYLFKAGGVTTIVVDGNLKPFQMSREV